jgi:uncharacterized protein (TIGR03000 family)
LSDTYVTCFIEKGGESQMLRQTLTKLVLGLAVSAGVVALGNGTAEAHLFGHHGSCGSSGGSWGSSGGSWGSSGGSWGSSGGSWGSSGGSWGSSGCCGSCGGYEVYYGSCGSSGGSYGGEIYSPAMPMQSAPMMAPPSGTPTPPPTPPAPGVLGAPTGRSTYNADAAYLLVSVPADAKVFVNDRATVSTGAERQYVSHGLEQGMRYEYTVRAEMVRDGKTVTETKTVQLSAGNSSNVAFDLTGSDASKTAKAPNSVRTSVMLHVPADAKVYLAGQEMKSTGAEREFSTSKLAAGGQWNNYQIRVVSQGESQEKTLTLKAGESRDVSFDFPAHVASATH